MDIPRGPVAATPRRRRGYSAGDAAAATWNFCRDRRAHRYQGESDERDQPWAYPDLVRGLVRSWRALFERPDLFFGIVQIAARLDPDFQTLQLAALEEGHAAFAPTNDLGIGGMMLSHPPDKAGMARRIARATRAVAFGEDLAWCPPSFKRVRSVALGAKRVEVVVDLENVAGPLEWRSPINLGSLAIGSTDPDVFRYASATASADVEIARYDYTPLRCDLVPAGLCAWASIYVRTGDGTLCALNATTTPSDDAAMVLTADVPFECAGGSFAGTSHVDGKVPLVSVYDSATGLPVQRWVDVEGDASNAVAYPAKPPRGPAVAGQLLGGVDLGDFWQMWGDEELGYVNPWPPWAR